MKKPKNYFDQLFIVKTFNGYVVKAEIHDFIGPKISKEMGEWFLKASKFLESNKKKKVTK